MKHPQKKQPKPKKCKAKGCENTFTQFRSTDKACSKKCLMEMNAMKQAGRVNPKQPKPKQTFTSLKKRFDSRDKDGLLPHVKNYFEAHGYDKSSVIVCEACKVKAAVDIHHIIPRSKFGRKRKDEQDAADNLIALCRGCHDLAHKNKLPTLNSKNN